MARTPAQDGVKGDNALSGHHATGPLIRDRAGYHAAPLGPPSVALAAKRRCQGYVALMVPVGTNGDAAVVVGRGRRGGRVPGTKDVEGPQAGRVFRPRSTAGVLQGAAQLAVVQVVDMADGQDVDGHGGTVDYFVAQLGRDRQAVENQGLDMLEDVAVLQRREDDPQRRRVEAGQADMRQARCRGVATRHSLGLRQALVEETIAVGFAFLTRLRSR